jgi:hypothetical protein
LQGTIADKLELLDRRGLNVDGTCSRSPLQPHPTNISSTYALVTK